MSNVSKGNYYKRKTRDYFNKLGYHTVLTEFTCAQPIGNGRIIYRKIDILGSDGVSMNGKEIIFWNSKATTEDREDGITKMKSQAKVEFEKYPFPPCVRKQVIIWLPKQKPIIYDL